MEKLFQVVDSAPGLHLFAVSITLFFVARSMRRDVTFIASWQDVCGLGTFMFLLVGRLFWSKPRVGDTDAVIVILFQAIAFGLIAFALAGVVGMTFHLCRKLWNDCGDIVQYLTGGRKKLRQQQVLESVVEQHIETARQQKKDIRLETELAIEFQVDKGRREDFLNLLDVYSDESLSVDEYRARMDQFREAIAAYTPSKSRSYRSLQEIIDDFDNQLASVNQSQASEFEKESLRSLIQLEKQNAIQRFIQQ